MAPRTRRPTIISEEFAVGTINDKDEENWPTQLAHQGEQAHSDEQEMNPLARDAEVIKAAIAREPQTKEFGDLYEAAAEIARARREKLYKLRAALRRNDSSAALTIARELCGLNDDEERNRTHTCVH